MYRFWLDIPGQGIIQFYPFNSQLKWVWKRKTGYRFYQLTLETKLIFKDDPKNSVYDFTNLYNLERQGLTCTKVPITIDKYCDCDDTWETGHYSGYIRLNECDWDVSDCTVDAPITVQDPYTCLTSSWQNEVNMFDYGDPVVETSPFYGIVQYEECEYTHQFQWQPPPSVAVQKAAIRSYFWNNPADDCITTGEGWTIVKDTFSANAILDINDGIFDGPPQITWNVTIRTQYAREFSADVAEPPGPGWIAVAGGWARPVNISTGPLYESGTPEADQAIAEEWPGYETDYGILAYFTILGMDSAGNSTLGNGKELGALLTDLVSPCGLTVVSDFLNINPDNTHPANDYYTNAVEDAQGIVLYQISDIARIDETQSATVALIKLKELLDALKAAFNLDIEIVDDTILRIEHLSYWPNTVNLDLTQAEFLKFIESKWKYTYDQESQPKNEIIAWDHETDGRGNDFDGYPIEYDNDCVTDVENKQDRVTLASGYLSNLRFIVGNEDYYDTTDVIVMVSTTDLVINSATQPISGRYVLNGNLAMGYLIPRYYPYGRPFKTGNINKVSTPMFAILRNRLQAPITIPFSCDNLSQFDPAGLVKTQLGACEIETATYTDPENQMEFKLRAK